MRIQLLAVSLLLLSASSCSHAAGAGASAHPTIHVPTIPARAEDVGSIDGLMKAFYAVVNVAPDEPRQWARDRTLYSPWIHFVGVEANRRLEIFDHQRFVDESEPLVKAGFAERELRRIVRQYGDIASVESSYLAEVGPEKRTSRGVNYLQLYFDGKRWWVASVVWQFEDAQHPIPPELLPSGS